MSRVDGLPDKKTTDSELISVLRGALQNEEKKIEKAQQEIFKLKMELLELGVELPLGE